jgi:hypothetical protein
MSAHPPISILKIHVTPTLKGREPELCEFLVNVFGIVENGGDVSAEQLAALKEIASDKREWVSNFGRVVLGSLAERNSNARHAIIEMAHSPVVHVRVNAILCLNEKCPDELVLDIISLLIRDKSSKVREKAADWVRHFKIDALAPILEQALAMESSATVKQVLVAEIGMLRNGYYILHTDSEDSYMVTPSPEGRKMRKISGGSV